MYSKATLALFAALTATISVAALPTSYGNVELTERDFGYENADLVERDFYDADLVEREFYDIDFEELAARQDPADPAASQAQLAPPTPVTSAAQPGQGRHGHGHGRGGHGHGHGHGQGVGHGHGHGHGFKHPAHHFKSDGTLKSKSGRRRANRKHRKAQEAAAAAQGGPQAPVPAPAPVDPAAMAPPVATREFVLEERGLLESLGLKARVSDLTIKQNLKMNKAKTDCEAVSSKKDKKRCLKNLDKIIQLTKERNYKVGEFIKQTNHHDVFLSSDPNAVAPPTSPSAARL
jgi:hypothetical protein